MTSLASRMVDRLGPRLGPSLEIRAALALKLVAALNVPGLLLAGIGGVASSSLLVATSVVATTAITVLAVVEARALDRRERWAVAAARPLLVLLVVFGVYSVVVAFGEGWLKVPFDVALATWAWFGASDVSPAPRHDRRSAAIIAATGALLAVVWYGPAVFGWGGLLDVHQPDLRAALGAECGDPGTGPPPAITVTYDWSWTASGAFPSGLDVVVIGWTGRDAVGRPLYLLGATPASGAGIREGRQGEPSLALALQAESESAGSWHWGVQLSDQQLAPGHIEFRLTRARDDAPEPGPLTITASYIHLGLWRQDALPVTCSW